MKPFFPTSEMLGACMMRAPSSAGMATKNCPSPRQAPSRCPARRMGTRKRDCGGGLSAIGTDDTVVLSPDGFEAEVVADPAVSEADLRNLLGPGVVGIGGVAKIVSNLAEELWAEDNWETRGRSDGSGHGNVLPIVKPSSELRMGMVRISILQKATRGSRMALFQSALERTPSFHEKFQIRQR